MEKIQNRQIRSPQRLEDVRVRAVVFSSAQDNKPKAFEGKLSELLGFHRVRPEKNGPAFSLVTYVDGAPRGNAGVERVNAITLDFDHLTNVEYSKLLEELLRVGHGYVIYTTFSHRRGGDDDNCVRIIFRLSRPLSREEFPRVHRGVASMLGGKHDLSAKDPARLFYLPACPAERLEFAFIQYIQGPVFDVDALLVGLPAEAPQTTEKSRDLPKVAIHGVPAKNVAAKFSGLSNVLRECEAFGAIEKSIRAGSVLKHDHGLALFHMCMWIQDGVEWFLKNVPGWPVTDGDRRELEHSIKKNYSPWSCRRMQEAGLCPYSGQPNPCLPERQAVKSRSPYAFAFGKKSIIKTRMMMEKLKREVGNG
jgi:hypothetical protein